MMDPHQGNAPGRSRSSGRPASIVVQRRVEWSDTDASGNYHNTAALRLVEVAETALLERLGLLEDVFGRLPRVHVSVDYLRPMALKDPVEVRATVVEVGRTSVRYDFELASREATVARASVVAVLLDGEGWTPTPWPESHRRLLMTAGPQRPELLVEG
jgi:2-aminobenzoate-CoA ligase